MIYDNISELPVKIYDKILKSSNLLLLVVDGEYSDSEVVEAWDRINKELFEEFGVKDGHKENLLSRIRYIEHLKKYYLTGERFAKTLANLELAKRPTDGEAHSYVKVCTSLSGVLKFRIDYNAVTTSEFFHYLELAESISKQHNND